MIKFFGWALLLFSNFALADQISTLPCDLEVSIRSRALVRIVEIGIELKIIKPNDVLPLLDEEAWFNPYRLQNSSPEALALRQSFDRHSLTASESERAQVKSALTAKIQVHQQGAERIDESKKATEQIFAPVILGQLKKRGYTHDDHTPGIGWFEGRPVFITRVSVGTSDLRQSILFDPFHPNPRQRAVILEKSGSSVARFDTPQFFEKNSIPYAAFLSGRQFIDLNLKANVASARFRFPGIDKYGIFFGNPTFVPNGTDPKIVFDSSSTSRDDVSDQLSVVDLMRPKDDPRVLINNVKISGHHPRVDVIDGESFLSYYAKNAVYVYDFARAKLLKRFPVTPDFRHKHFCMIHSDQGRKFLVYAEEPRDSHKHRIQIVDLETRAVKTAQGRFELPSSIDFILVDGVPHLYFTSEENLVLVNLRTKRSERYPIGHSPQISHFERDGREFIIWPTQDGDLKIFDVRARHLTLSLAMLPEMSYHATPFQYLGEWYAVISVSNSWPYLVQLTKRPSY